MLYANVIGSITYVLICTKPNITPAVSVVNIYIGNPKKEHWNIVKWIFHYLAGIVHYGIIFYQNDELGNVVGYINTEYTCDLDSRRFMIGFVFTFGEGGLICQKSVLQSTTVFFTTKAEYVGVSEIAKKAFG